ncbi:MAG: hypothetical protein ACOC5D_02755 [Thermoplasmatota archaeon]
MIFEAKQHDTGKLQTLETGADKTISKGDPLAFSNGYVERATDSANTVRFVALENASDTDEGDELLALYVQGIEFEAETAANTAQDQVGMVFGIDSDRKVENTDSGGYTDGDVFLVTGIVGAASDKKVRGYFLDRVSEANSA